MKAFPSRLLIATSALVFSLSVPRFVQAEEAASPAPSPAAATKEKKEKPEKADKTEKAENAEKKAPARVRGEVTEINQEGKSIKLSSKGKDAESTTLIWTDVTKFKKGKDDAAATDIVVGSALMVALAEDGTAKTITVAPAKDKKAKKEKPEAAPKTTE